MSGPDATVELRRAMSRDELWDLVGTACRHLSLSAEPVHASTSEGLGVARVLLSPHHDLDVVLEPPRTPR